MAKGTAVSKPEEATDLVANLSDDLLATLSEEAGSGLEDVGEEGFAIPFINLLQGLSPEVDSGSDQHVEGASPGKLLDSVTKEIIDGQQGIEVIPAHIRSLVIEWTPRDQGGGFVAEYRDRAEAEEYATPGNELKDTVTYTVLYRPYGSDREYRAAKIGMESTKLKVARTWNSQLSMLKVPVEVNGEVERVNPPVFMTRWRLHAVRQENAKGRFYNFGIQFESLVEDAELVSKAKQLRDAVSHQELRGKDGDVPEPEVGEGGSDDF